MAKKTPTDTPLKGYKAYDANLKCRDFQYAIGSTYETDQKPIRCGNVGFHWCENPMDTWRYYDLTTSRFTVVEASGQHDRGTGDTKIASAKLTIGVELHLGEIIERAVAWMLEFCSAKKEPNAKDASSLAASGYASSLAASGYASSLAASGYASRLAASGYASSLAASGNASRLAASGNDSRLAASGNDSSLAASGNASSLAASGNDSRLAASGNDSRVKMGENGCAALAWWDGKRPRFSVLYVGENGIEAGKWYRLDAEGKPYEVGV